jgi:uncharacterized protein YndB with AHSA1/START domain
MEQQEKTQITVETTVNSPVEGLWLLWSQPEHITKWNQASDDWHTPYAENDLRTGGNFKSTMAAKDGSFSFDFGGVYSNVVENSLIEYEMADGRTVKVNFIDQDGKTKIVETFDAEGSNSVDMQRAGWQAILDNFKKYAESR